MIRVLQVVGGLGIGGAETMVMNLYKQIDKRRYQFDFLVYKKQDTPYTELVKSFGGRIIYMAESKVRNPVSFFCEMKKICREYGPYDVVHSHMDSHNAFSLTSARFLHIPIRISHSHTTKRLLAKSVLKKIYYAISGWLINANSTIRLSCGADAGKALYGNADYDIMYNPINIESFVHVDEKLVSEFRERFHLNDKKKVLGIVGRLNVEKNHLFVLKIAEKLKKDGLNFVLLIAGDGPLKLTLEKEIVEKKLNQQVFLLGNRSDIPVFFKSIDLLLMPSFFEGFPVTLIESQTSGVPAIISNHISEEVDLGFGLIKKCRIDDGVSCWTDLILKTFRQESVDLHSKLTVLKEKGFDSKSSTLKFEKLYERI